jgi:hypothetical protein
MLGFKKSENYFCMYESITFRLKSFILEFYLLRSIIFKMLHGIFTGFASLLFFLRIFPPPFPAKMSDVAAAEQRIQEWYVHLSDSLTNLGIQWTSKLNLPKLNMAQRINTMSNKDENGGPP